MILYQCDVCGGICLEEQIILVNAQTEKYVFLLDLCPSCFNAKFDKVILTKAKLIPEDGGDDEKSFRDRH